MSTTTVEPRSRPRYVPAVGPKLRRLLAVVAMLLALLAANSLYLSGITFADWLTGRTYENWFYQYMFLGHLLLGLLLIVPFLAFAIVHMSNTRRRKNRRAVRVGYGLFGVCLLLLASGLLLLRVGGLELKAPVARGTVYWLHVTMPLVALWLYWLHRLAGPKIKWKFGAAYGGITGALVLGLLAFHTQDPREWNVVGSKEGVRYFEPSLARTSTGKFIPAEALDMNDYCLRCHADVHAGWSDSVHRFSSFNNPAYLAIVREPRSVPLKRDGSVKASRWCAGCHDPVPFFSGAFDDPEFDDVAHPTAHAGITCTVCHAITHFNSNRGNADYTIEEPLHYPFATSDDPLLQWVNNQLVKAKPSFHKKTFLKDLHRTSEFCSTCHKVHLPGELTHYREFLRGQNHYDSHLLSGVSGHGARSFYYPERAENNCNRCHMPLEPSDDFGARFFDGGDRLSVHDHLFPSANTGIAWLRERPEVVAAHREFLQDIVRVDLFGLREGGRIDGRLIAPLRPEVPSLAPGKTYLLETVIRTLKLGHHFTQGTADSNEVWLEVVVMSGGEIIARSGGLDERGEVDRRAHFVNAFVIDKDGNRINRRNAQDIFVALYDHQIPPGAGQLVHYALRVPEHAVSPITVEVALKYRKFDREYLAYVADSLTPRDPPLRGHEPGEPYVNRLPITVLATDTITFPIAGGEGASVRNPPREIPEWQRWNDYGIGAFLKGKAELRQAEAAFTEVERLGRFDGPLNLARVLEREGRLDEAADAVRRASAHDDPPAPPWTVAWLSGVINRQQLRLEEAERNFRQVLDPANLSTDARRRGFDFSRDYVVRNLLGLTLFDRAKRERGEARKDERERLLRAAVSEFETTLESDSENVTAHYNLQLLYGMLGDAEHRAEHRRLHARYKPDDNARDRAVRLAREQYPAADHAAEAVVIYELRSPESGAVAKAKGDDR